MDSFESLAKRHLEFTLRQMVRMAEAHLESTKSSDDPRVRSCQARVRADIEAFKVAATDPFNDKRLDAASERLTASCDSLGKEWLRAMNERSEAVIKHAEELAARFATSRRKPATTNTRAR